MKIFSACLFTETNSFSPIPTSLDNFAEGVLYDGPAAGAPELGPLASPWLIWRDRAAEQGIDFESGLIAFAEPAGMITRSAFAELAHRLVESLRAALPADIVLLTLHGAMMADGCEDVEGELIERVRDVVGPDVVIAVLIDPHAHLSDKMVASVDLLAAFQEWPHIDVEPRARHLFDLAVACAAGEVSPVAATFDCRMISAFPTGVGPMRRLVHEMRGLEEEPGGILSANIIHGFPWGDNKDVGARILIWADGDETLACATAKRIGRRLFADRDAVSFRPDFTIDEALDYIADAPEGLIVLCDAGDNVPGGGAGDSTFFLRRVLERGEGDILFGPLWDPMATEICFKAEEGATLPLRIGGKSGISSGQPIDVVATVRRLLPSTPDKPSRFGDRVWISFGPKLDLILHSVRATTASPRAITDLGLTPGHRKTLIGKMLMHGGAAFAPVAREVRTVATPGALEMPFSEIRLSRRTTPWWPRWDDPFDDASGTGR